MLSLLYHEWCFVLNKDVDYMKPRVQLGRMYTSEKQGHLMKLKTSLNSLAPN